MIETEFQAGNTTLAALDNGGAGPVIIGLHGFLDNAASLAPLAPYLHNFRFIALDLAGHGLSGHRPHGAYYNQADYLQDLYALIDAQKWEQVILLGHSLGGILATLYAGLFPEQISGVVSIDACGPLTQPAETSQSQMRDSIINRHQKSRNRLRVVDLDVAVEARCAITDIHEGHARDILKRNLTQDAGGHCFWSSDPKLRTKSTLRLTDEQAQNIMQAITCPVWFGSASSSFKEVDKMYAIRSSWFRNSQLVCFEGGHHIHMEKPDDVGRAIREFVEQL